MMRLYHSRLSFHFQTEWVLDTVTDQRSKAASEMLEPGWGF